MTYSGDQSRLKKDNLPERFAMNRRRAIVWVFVAFGLLIAGLLSGTILVASKREWAWIFPAASIGAYLLAFRRGMLLWNPAVDRTWRRYLLDREVIADDEEAFYVAGEDSEETLKILRQGTSRPTRHELRVIR